MTTVCWSPILLLIAVIAHRRGDELYDRKRPQEVTHTNPQCAIDLKNVRSWA